MLYLHILNSHLFYLLVLDTQKHVICLTSTYTVTYTNPIANKLNKNTPETDQTSNQLTTEYGNLFCAYKTLVKLAVHVATAKNIAFHKSDAKFT